MKTVSAYAPAALSFIFKSCPSTDISKSGSIGVGCTIDKGVTARVSVSKKTTVVFNKKPLKFPTVLTALIHLSDIPVSVELSSSLPLGCGFGLSGACTLACLYASNTLLRLGKTKEELALIAHSAEIEHKTGLGTVATEITGGFLLKNAPGIPVDATNVQLIGQKLFAIILGPLKTPIILKDLSKVEKINKEAENALHSIRVLPHPSLIEVIDISYQYALESFLITPRIESLIHQLHKQHIHATMAMLGEVIICDKKPHLDYNYRVEEFTVSQDTVQLLL